MKTRFELIGWALRESWREGYSLKKLLADFKAGLTVGIVAIPLGMALGIASGVSPQNGLYTVICAGAVIAILGGSRFQVSGPTAAFVVLLVPIVGKFGISGLLVAGLLAGIILILLGLMRLADVIQYIPHPVTTGFTTGIAVVIAVIQLKDFLGVSFETQPEHFHDRVLALAQALPSMKWVELTVGVFTIFLLILSLKKIKILPAPVIALTGATLFATLGEKLIPGFLPATIGSTFTYFTKSGEVALGIPSGLPQFALPWAVSTPSFPAFTLTWSHIVEIFPYAFSIAMLGAIESLLSAVVADGATRTKHNPNSELLAQGVGNVITPFFGGVPATGAIARTMTNIRFGAVSPVAAVVHALIVILALVLLAPVINYIPMAALAAILLFIAYNMAERKHFVGILRSAPRDDKIVLLACFAFTVFTDMTLGVGVGVGLAALLFIRRVAALTQAHVLQNSGVLQELNIEVPRDVFVYRVRGSLFFGAANSALAALQKTSSRAVRKVIVDLTGVQLMDATGAVALNSALEQFVDSPATVVIVTAEDSIRELIRHTEVHRNHPQKFLICSALQEALAV